MRWTRARIIAGSAFGAFVLLAAGTAAGAVIAGPIDSSGVIHACYSNPTGDGQHAILLENAGSPCPSGMAAISWNQQGPAGATGPAGPSGPQGSVGPAGATGPAGPKGDVGAPGPAGPAGAPGPQGAVGATGAAGADGNTVLSGAGAPAGPVGRDGDFYLDTAADVLYGPKSGGSWPAVGTSLVGPAGPQGPQGAPGLPGASGGLDTMIGTPCDVGTPSAGTLGVTYTPQTDGTDSISWACDQNNPVFALNLSIPPGVTGQSCFFGSCSTVFASLTVTSSPGSINCTGSADIITNNFFDRGTCTDAFPKGTTITLTAVPGGFKSAPGPWSGCDSVSADGSTCTVTMNSVKNITVPANFTG